MTAAAKRGRPALTAEQRAARDALVPVVVRLPPDARAILAALQTALGGSQSAVVAEALRALDREMRKPAKRRKGPRAIVV